MDEISVTNEEIRISGSKEVLARAASEDADHSTAGVLSFVQDWRARADKDENFSRWTVVLGNAVAAPAPIGIRTLRG